MKTYILRPNVGSDRSSSHQYLADDEFFLDRIMFSMPVEATPNVIQTRLLREDTPKIAEDIDWLYLTESTNLISASIKCWDNRANFEFWEDTELQGNSTAGLYTVFSVLSERMERYGKASALIREWMNEEDDYDEQTWSMVENDLPPLSIGNSEDIR